MAATVYLPTINLLQQIGARGVKTVSKTECRSLRQGRISARLLRRESPKRTLLHPAFRAAEAFRHVLEPSVPAAKSPQRARFRGALVAARSALEHQRVLTKLIAQLVDVKSGRHAADCHETAVARPSSTGIMKTLYEASFTATAADGRHGFAMTPLSAQPHRGRKGKSPRPDSGGYGLCQLHGPSDLKKGLALRFGRQYSNDISQ